MYTPSTHDNILQIREGEWGSVVSCCLEIQTSGFKMAQCVEPAFHAMSTRTRDEMVVFHWVGERKRER